MSEVLPLADNEVHIWSVDTSCVSPELIAGYRALMSAQELERNGRYRFEHSRHTDCVARALVRTVLSRYVDKAPTEWTFAKGEHGKPELTHSPQPLRFNLSHSGDYVVCAVSWQKDVGLDIEYIERKNDVLAIADRFFSKPELTDLFALPSARQEDRFFDYWTLKEAYMKAHGQGISLGLGNFSFKLDDSDAIGVSFADKLEDNPADWCFRLFYPVPKYSMALAFRIGDENPQRFSVRQFSTIPLQG
ncbi:MAG TPA: 4'-phosphopantetheinyl transferase superfamily protein [Porticoccus sp.]|nr:4'-phosphopantetheinyl transferase superfamily protein [Porticoccus sp.]